MTSRSAIVTGDDFGISSPVNRAIIEAHSDGVLTSASLMVTGEAFEEAVALAHRHPSLAVGLHLVLISGRSALPHSQIPHLVSPTGRFSSRPVGAGLNYQLNRSARRELALEIRAQLEKFRQTGLRLSHLDGHRNMHLPPVVLKILWGLREEFGVRVIRLPSEELGTTLALDRSGWLEKAALAWTFQAVRRLYARRHLTSAGIRFTDRVYGLLQTGRMSEEYLLGLIPRIQADRIEIYSHLTTGEERAALLSPRVREALFSHGFRLATFSDEAESCTPSLSFRS
ncbi:MAG: hopanoid biosynthesis-associated protein HpnK [Candidatus Omnitrophica bacterium]|nr:hopanoid biosynthesis-associated protein HpnK [Candidatus Omnitrophota bacterium]